MNVMSASYQSPLGAMTMASDGTSLVGLWFDGQRHFGARFGAMTPCEELPLFAEVRRWLDAYFAGQRSASLPPISLMGTPFQQRVWRALQTIPYGQTVTYGQLAAMLHSSARAVGGAVGRNPISVLVPCHRVVGANGQMTGYAGGLTRKTHLLSIENIAPSSEDF